ncbi:hypothetical protein M885DRAFT_537507 [Pelagophyceae sp. CCMP2097]|nr:hypothetical protein M885DRAFT_537507 [Pelagophyceae sp. CCMP2097]
MSGRLPNFVVDPHTATRGLPSPRRPAEGGRAWAPHGRARAGAARALRRGAAASPDMRESGPLGLLRCSPPSAPSVTFFFRPAVGGCVRRGGGRDGHGFVVGGRDGRGCHEGRDGDAQDDGRHEDPDRCRGRPHRCLRRHQRRCREARPDRDHALRDVQEDGRRRHEDGQDHGRGHVSRVIMAEVMSTARSVYRRTPAS